MESLYENGIGGGLYIEPYAGEPNMYANTLLVPERPTRHTGCLPRTVNVHSKTAKKQRNGCAATEFQ